jgi:hypothetical protein
LTVFLHVMPTSFDTPIFDHASNYTGHKTEPIPPLYQREKVVETIVRLATDPEDEFSRHGGEDLDFRPPGCAWA